MYIKDFLCSHINYSFTKHGSCPQYVIVDIPTYHGCQTNLLGCQYHQLKQNAKHIVAASNLSHSAWHMQKQAIRSKVKMLDQIMQYHVLLYTQDQKKGTMLSWSIVHVCIKAYDYWHTRRSLKIRTVFLQQ